MICMLDASGIAAYADPAAPGVYVDDASGTRMKIGSLGLRVRKGCTYHGLALNVAMDLEPFSRINPCGYQNLRMTQTSTLGGAQDRSEEHTSELQSLMRISYAVFCLKKKKKK